MATSIPRHEVEIDKRGAIFDQRQVDAVLDALPSFTDLFVFAHGWNNDLKDARDRYEDLFGNIEKVLDSGAVKGLEGRRFGSFGVFWPSKKFTDEELIPGGGAASATAASDTSLHDVLEELKRDPDRLGSESGATDPVRDANLTRAQELIPALETSEEARREFVFQLRSVVDPVDAESEDGSEEFFTEDPLVLFEELSEPVTAPGAVGAGGATSVAGGGGAAGLGDRLRGFRASARRLANYTTYYQMKQRAGLVGRAGLSQVLRQVRRSKPDVRLHLIGHSFGGRVVTAAAHALDGDTPNVSLTLLQAAFSHNGLAENYDGKGRNGFFREVLTKKRASGPIVITHTKNDRAVGIAYPLASRIARDPAAALGDEKDPYGGMGRNGAQHTPEAKGNAGNLLAVGKKYDFQPGKVYNLRSDEFIKGHSDIAGFQVGYAILTAAKAG